MPVTVRPANKSDFEAISRFDLTYPANRYLHVERRDGTGAPAFTLSWQEHDAPDETYNSYPVERLREAIAKVDLFLIAEVGGRVAGLLMIMLPSWTDAAEISDLAVDMLPPGELRTFLSDPEVRQALRSGSVFPDSGYAADDEYGEMAHWEPFTDAYLRWIVERHPAPWTSVEDRRRVAFLLGAMSHGLADQVTDSLFMHKTDQYDGTSENLDTATETWLVIEHDPRVAPLEIFLPGAEVVEVFRDRLGWRYETWRFGHGLGATLIAVFGLHHALDTGRYSASPLLAGFWQAALAVALATLALIYLVKPLLQLLRPYRVSGVRKVAARTWRSLSRELQQARSASKSRRVFAFDRDPVAIARAREWAAAYGGRLTLIARPFAETAAFSVASRSSHDFDVASSSHSTRSASPARARARRTPSCSTGSSVSRMPAVSSSVTG